MTGVRLEVPGGEAAAFVALPGTAGIAAAPDGSFLITSGATGLLRWPVGRSAAGDLRVGPPEPLGPLAGLPTGRVRLGRDGRTLAVVLDGEVGRVVILDLQGRDPPITLAGHPNLERLDLSPDGRWVATGTWQGNGVKVWDARRGTLARELAVEGSADVLFSPDGRSLVTASGDEYAIWDVGSWTLRLQHPQEPGDRPTGPGGLQPRRPRAGDRHEREAWCNLSTPSRAGSWRPSRPLNRKTSPSLGFSPDGRLLVVALDAAGIQVWDLGAIRRELESLGLDWPTATGAGPVASPMLIPEQIVVEDAPWIDPLARGEDLARSGRWDDAAVAFEEAIASGARHVDAQTRRVLLRRARGDETAYGAACRQLLQTVRGVRACAACRQRHRVGLRPRVRGRRRLLARSSSSPRWPPPAAPLADRLNTLGAILYRAGRFEEAVRQLERSVEVHGAGGTPYDALFLAMAHHQLGHADEARRWLRLGTVRRSHRHARSR